MQKIILFSAVIFCWLNLHAQPGELDSTFGINGIVKTPINSGRNSIAIQADGKILIGSTSLARYNTDGSLDSSFGGGIIPIWKKPGRSICAIAIQADEKIVVAVETRERYYHLLLARYNKDGSQDATFGEDGIITTLLSWGNREDGSKASFLAIQNDNKIIVANNKTIMRLNKDGSDFTAFGPGFTITSLALQSDDKIVVAGGANGDFALARFNADCSIDSSFSDDGKQTTDFGYDESAYSITIEDNGKIVAAGGDPYIHINDKFAVARYNADGTLDRSFSGDGRQTTDFSLDNGVRADLTVTQTDGKIVVAGTAYIDDHAKFALARYNTDGTLDNAFGSNGKQIKEVNESILSSMVITKDKLYTGSVSYDKYQYFDYFDVLARFQLNEPAVTTIRINNPYNYQSFTGPATINITALTKAVKGTVSKVEFYNGTTLLSSDHTFPYSFTWKNVPVGNYALTAKATDNTGFIATSPDLHISVVPDIAPVVTITSPYNNQIYRGPTTVSISADATDGDPGGTISKVEFYIGSTLMHTDSTSPYTYSWENVPPGKYAVTAKATDNTRNATTSSVVNFSMQKNLAPTVSIQILNDNKIFEAPATIPIFIAANDTDDEVAEGYLYSGTTLIKHFYLYELEQYYDWSNVPVGDYTLTAKVIDNWGLTTTSAPVHVKVIPKQPTVTITNPPDNTIYGEPAEIFMNAKVTSQDMDGSITKVEFYNGAKLLHTENSAPFNYTWNNVSIGNYTIIAKTTFSSGKMITSAPVHVSVTDKPSPISISIPSNILDYTSWARIKINATVTDPDSTIKKVEFYHSNGSYQYLLHTELKFPYGFLWTYVPAGNHTIIAKAIDDSGKVTTSNAINVSVVEENVPPVVSIASPVADTIYTGPATIRLIAEAKDPNDRIGKVEFYNGTALLRTEYYYPYTYSWANVQPGTYTITAKAYDDKGLSATSEPVTVTVDASSLPIVKSKPVSENNKADLKGALSLTLSPNPARSTLQISTKSLQLNKPSTISVISASGVVMKTIQSNASDKVVQLDVSSLISGVYTVKVVSGDKVMYKRFVKL